MRLIDREGKPWLVAKDACDNLGTETRDVRKIVDEDEVDTIHIPTTSGTQEMLIISEPGFYKLVGRSRKPEAKAFDRWVRHEVLPAIRKTGSYGTLSSGIERLQAIEEKLDQLTVQSKIAPLGRVISIRSFIDQVWPDAEPRYRNRAWSEICFELRRFGRGPIPSGESQSSEFGMFESDSGIALPVVLRQASYFIDDRQQPLLMNMKPANTNRRPRNRNRKPKQNG